MTTATATTTAPRLVPPGKGRRDRLDRPLKVLFPFWVVVSALIVLFPIYLVVMVSVAPGSALFGERPDLLVTEPTLDHWRQIIDSGSLWGPLAKSLTVATLTTVVAIVIAAPAAYVISRMPSGIRYTVVIGLLVTRMFPEFAIGISVATRFARVGLVDDYVGLVLAHLIGALPFITWILVGTFETIPRDLEEAARIDGASRMGTLLRVVFPLAAAGIAVAALFVWLYSWNEFLYARLLTTNQNTLPLEVFRAIDRGSRQQMATIAAVLTLPILLVVYFLQKHLRPGALAGAVKG
ncbi:MAG TPA: carbohydrate ABC transporter permease [Acidimicrobiales bacterium]|nr:carbohydrate ABC transporter permease [Acidimicrobiales bacterium]